jgi:AAA+ ATPase superfamily predicted ATPase
MFVNRSSELARLESWWAESAPRPALVWGRRRVGKTALVRYFARQKSCVFHTGAGRAASAELSMIARLVSALDRSRGSRDLLARPYASWDDAFDHLAGLAEDEPLLLVLDEFPELAATSPELPNVLRAFLDRIEGSTRLRIIICGSAVRYMQALGEERQPLYGRTDLVLPVHPFAPAEAALMLPDLAPAERAAIYGIIGGVPLYLSWWDSGENISGNLAKLACEPGARLLTEGQLILATEAEAGEYPSAVLHAIANGKTRHNEIKDAIGADPSRTLERLMTVRLIERIEPVTEIGRTRRRIYAIADNFLAFYLKLLSPFRGDIDAGLGRTILPVLTEALDDHQGRPWESAFRSHLVRLAAEGSLGKQIIAIGPWWATDGHHEIDAVAVSGRSRTPILAGEAKWARTVDARKIVPDLLRKAEQVPSMANDPQLVIAARDQVTHAPKGIRVLTAADIFA